MAETNKQNDWSKPAAMAIPEGGIFQTPAGTIRPDPSPELRRAMASTIIAKVIPGREETVREYGKNIEKAVAEDPHCLAVLKLHYLRWVALQH